MQSESSTGMGFLGILTLIFITLRLTGHIDWDWIWVLAPLWIPMVFAVFVAAVGFLFYSVVRKRLRK